MGGSVGNCCDGGDGYLARLCQKIEKYSLKMCERIDGSVKIFKILKVIDGPRSEDMCIKFPTLYCTFDLDPCLTLLPNKATKVTDTYTIHLIFKIYIHMSV